MAVLTTLVLAACGSAGRPAAGPASPATEPTAPLATSLSSASGTWVTVPMGETSDPLNTYWQLLYLGAGAANWIVRTPPDVADNGGLVMGQTNDGLDVAFRPSNQLRFTPLAVTTDGGATYTPGLVPVALADVPDALSINAAGQASVLADSGVHTSPTGLSGWQPSLQACRGTGAHHRCVNVKALFQFALPLFAQMGWTQHGKTLDLTPVKQLSHDECGLDGLTYTDIVCH